MSKMSYFARFSHFGATDRRGSAGRFFSPAQYLRQKEIGKLQEKYDRKFQTKTSMAVEIVKRLVPYFTAFDKPIEIIVDGGYAKDTVLLPLDKLDFGVALW